MSRRRVASTNVLPLPATPCSLRNHTPTEMHLEAPAPSSSKARQNHFLTSIYTVVYQGFRYALVTKSPQEARNRVRSIVEESYIQPWKAKGFATLLDELVMLSMGS